MTTPGPDFDELVGAEVDPAERERLLRVHDALLEAGPPPELSPGTAPPVPEVVSLNRRRRRRAFLALAAALGAVAFAVGFAVAESGGPSTDRVIAMSGAGGASASLEIFEIDDAGNWPMELEVRDLAPGDYELWLTRDGKLAAPCGDFVVAGEKTTVPLNAPYRLRRFDAWVVVENGKTKPVLTT